MSQCRCFLVSHSFATLKMNMTDSMISEEARDSREDSDPNCTHYSVDEEDEETASNDDDDEESAQLSRFQVMLLESASLAASMGEDWDSYTELYDTDSDFDGYSSDSDSSLGSFESFLDGSRCGDDDDDYDYQADNATLTTSLPSSLPTSALCEAETIKELLYSMRMNSNSEKRRSHSPSKTAMAGILKAPKSPSSVRVFSLEENDTIQDPPNKKQTKFVSFGDPASDDGTVLFDKDSPMALYQTLVEESQDGGWAGYRVKHDGRLRPDDAFVSVTKERVQSYSTEIVRAVMAGDTDRVVEMAHAGHNLMCCNKFGESVLHTACRYGRIEMVQFILDHQEGGTLWCCDDYGRTPLHDGMSTHYPKWMMKHKMCSHTRLFFFPFFFIACWTTSPNFDLVQLILQREPGLMVTGDVRGCIPLEYVPKKNWTIWKEFLRESQERGVKLPERTENTSSDLGQSREAVTA